MISKHKKILLFMMFVVSCLAATAQSVDANYVKTEVITTSSGANSLITIDYFDKKGRISQKLSNGLSNGNFLRTYYEYNNNGLLGKQSSPMDSQNDVSYKKSYDLVTESQDSYSGDEFAYTDFTYDGLGQLSTVIGPGFDWYDDERKVSYTFSLNKENTIKCYAVSEQDGTLVDKGDFYDKGKLVCQRRTNENGDRKEVYIDDLGRKVLERSIGKENHDTYYVYDKLGRLRYILTPQYQKSPDISQNAYQYSYDKRNRIVSKVLPGCGKTIFEYDNSNRLVLMQDAQLRRDGLSRIFMYDALGRLCLQGTCTQAAHINEKNDVKYEPSQSGISQTGYVCQGACNMQGFELEEVRYYDNYDFQGNQCFSSTGMTGKLVAKERVTDGKTTVIANIDRTHTQGLLTGQLQVCSSGKKMYSAHYYDNRARLVESVSSYGEDKVLLSAYELNYAGQPEESLSILSYRGASHSLANTANYHPTTGKRMQSMLSIDGQASHIIARAEYDKLGRMSSCTQGNASTTYKYNTRGWLRGIKSPGLDEELMHTYYEVNEGNNYFNGNVGTVEFTLPNSRVRHHVEYNYDSLDRLTECIFYENDNDVIIQDWKYGIRIPSYDLNGNINILKRQGKKDDGTFGLVDDLELEYNGNQLLSIKDNAEEVQHQGSTDFKDNAASSVEYTYDENGAMLDDGNKGISFVEYDRLSFPKRVYMDNGHQVEYDYAPNSGKLRVVHHLLSPEPFSAHGLNVNEMAATSAIARDTTEYLGNFVIRNGKVDKVLFMGGFASMDDGVAKYHYFTQDQQGNVRAVFDEEGKVEQYLTYDALGNIIPELSSNVDFQPYAFNGKELDRTFGLNLHGFGFRSYDSVLGRWTSMDRKCEDYVSATPYAFCMNNFVNGMDPLGLDYWSTSNPETIRRFMENIKEHRVPGDSYRNFELHATDAEFLSNLTYNDRKGEYYVNFGRIEKGEATSVGVTLRAGMAVASDALRLINALQKINVGLFGVGNSMSVQNELFDLTTAMQTERSYMEMHTMSTWDLNSLNTRTFGKGTSKFISLSKTAGRAIGWGSVGISVFDLASYSVQGGTNINVYVKDIADIGIGVLSVCGGPIGLSIGIGYTLTMMYLESSGTINLERTY